MRSLSCCRTNNAAIDDKKQSTNNTYWSHFLTSTGHTLWAVRHKLCSSLNDDDDIDLPLAPRQSRKFVKILWQPSAFEHLEEHHGMDKIVIVDNVDESSPSRIRLPLTRCTGEDWTKYRPMVCLALQNVPKLSLQATQHVDWRSLLLASSSSSTVVVDLKQVVLEASELWNRRLFVGTNNEITNSTEYQTLLRQATLEYWREVRAMTKNPVSMQTALLRLEAALPWNHFANGPWQCSNGTKGLFQSLYQSGMPPNSITDNAVNALVASLDAVQALVFWTLWNLSRFGNAWERCANISNDQVQRDLSQLSIFKKQATQGKTISVKQISFLAAALLETVRVYPPVWTLPRTWHNPAQAVACKFDVLLCNRGTCRKWDPSKWLDDGTNNDDDDDDTYTIASFGLGKRYCPAGTGGLCAAYELIRSFVNTCSKIEECQPDQALNYSYLGPTLCVHGPQPFRVTLRS